MVGAAKIKLNNLCFLVQCGVLFNDDLGEFWVDKYKDWRKFLNERKEADISALIEEEKLKPEETRRFIDNAFRDGILKTTGTAIDKIMPPVSRFGGGNRAARKQNIIEKLLRFFEKYFGLV